MPANTPVLALPYPVSGDTVNVPRDIQALADKLDTLPTGGGGGSPALVTTLPTSPNDGQEVIYLVNATTQAGVLWRLRYNATATTYKWEFLGGAPMTARTQATSVANATSGWGDGTAPNTGPALTVPLAGDYMISCWARVAASFSNASNYTIGIGLAVGATAPSYPALGWLPPWPSGSTYPATLAIPPFRMNALAAAADLRMRYYGDAVDSAGYVERRMAIVPIRVT